MYKHIAAEWMKFDEEDYRIVEINVPGMIFRLWAKKAASR